MKHLWIRFSARFRRPSNELVIMGLPWFTLYPGTCCFVAMHSEQDSRPLMVNLCCLALPRGMLVRLSSLIGRHYLSDHFLALSLPGRRSSELKLGMITFPVHKGNADGEGLAEGRYRLLAFWRRLHDRCIVQRGKHKKPISYPSCFLGNGLSYFRVIETMCINCKSTRNVHF